MIAGADRRRDYRVKFHAARAKPRHVVHTPPPPFPTVYWGALGPSRIGTRPIFAAAEGGSDQSVISASRREARVAKDSVRELFRKSLASFRANRCPPRCSVRNACLFRRSRGRKCFRPMRRYTTLIFPDISAPFITGSSNVQAAQDQVGTRLMLLQ